MSLSFSISPQSHSFGVLKVGATSAPVTVTVTNTTQPLVLAVGSWVFFNLKDNGGQVAVGCGQGAPNGSSVTPPDGYDPVNMLVFCSMGTGTGNDQLEGVSSCTYGTAFNLAWQKRGGLPSTNTATANWIAVAWTAGAKVTLVQVSSTWQLSFTTDQGDQLCFSLGQVASGSTVPVPPAQFLSTNSLYVAAPSGTYNANGHAWEFIFQCDVNPGTQLCTLVYADNSGNSWGGPMNVFTVYWNSNGGITAQSVTGGTALLVQASLSAQAYMVFAHKVPNNTAVGLPGGFPPPASGISSIVGGPAGGDNVVHGYLENIVEEMIFTGIYTDGSGNQWNGIGDIFVVGAQTPQTDITINTIAAGTPEFALQNVTVPVTLGPTQSTQFNITCTPAFRGSASYSQGVAISFAAPLKTAFILLSYIGQSSNSVFPLQGGNLKGVMLAFRGHWPAGSGNPLIQMKSTLMCEAACWWTKQVDFDSPSGNTYLSKVFLRNEPFGGVTAQMWDNTVVSNVLYKASATTSQDSSLDYTGMLRWMQFDFEQNGEVHLLTLLVPANGGIMSSTLYVLQFEPRGPVYEGT